MKKLSTKRILFAGLAIVIITISMFLFVSISQSQKAVITSRQVNHTEKVLQHIQKIVIAAMDIQNGARGFALTGSENFMEPLKEGKKTTNNELLLLEAMMNSSPEQLPLLDSLKFYIGKRIIYSDSLVFVRQQNGLLAVTEMVATETGKEYSEHIRRIGNQLEQRESAVLIERKKKNDKTLFNLNIILYSILATVFFLSIYIVNRVKNDFTRRKRSEERFKSLLESAPDATVIANEKGEIILVNHQTENLFGYNKEELINQMIEILMPAGFREKHIGHRGAYYNEPKTRSMGAELDLYALRKDGSSFPVEISLSPLTTSDGVLVSAAIRDITERKKSEEAIKQLNKELESFTYSVSHDLRAPLRIIDGYAEILVTDYSERIDVEGKRILNIVQSNARKMGQLIDDLLDFSRTGRKELIKQRTDMTMLVHDVTDEQLTLSGSKATFDIKKLEPAMGDKNLLRQVWVNLISNALKYSGKNEYPAIQIRSVQHPDKIIYSIKDNGVGFNMKYAEKLFGVFQRLHSEKEFEGTGIGLALVSRIISRHDGKIWAESEAGNGATFFFSLPIGNNETK